MELQPTVFYIIAIVVIIAVLLILINRKLVKFDPLSKPTGIVLLVMMGAEMVDKMVKEKTDEKAAKFLTPYIMTVVVYIFLSNIAGLLSFESPTSNYSVTLSLAAVTCILIEYYAIKANGLKRYMKSLAEPMAPFIIMNVISKASTLLSLSLRLFGNIIAGIIVQGKVISQPLKMDMIGINDRFGESGKSMDLLKTFGLAAECIVKRAKALLNLH